MKTLKGIKSIFVLSAVFIMVISGALKANAAEPTPEAGAVISHQIDGVKTDRVKTLEVFLKKYNSPLADHAETFVKVADKYGMDYRLLPAISCMESTCGKFIIKDSNNAWGWGIYANNVIRFASFDEGIETVGKGIYEGYIKQGLTTPAKMAPIYTPPRWGHWLSGVTYFFAQIDEVSEEISAGSDSLVG